MFVTDQGPANDHGESDSHQGYEVSHRVLYLVEQMSQVRDAWPLDAPNEQTSILTSVLLLGVQLAIECPNTCETLLMDVERALGVGSDSRLKNALLILSSLGCDCPRTQEIVNRAFPDYEVPT